MLSTDMKNRWNDWTEKSAAVSFQKYTGSKGVGDGEHKLGVEFDAKPCGQNSPYDLIVDGEMWEVKKTR